MSVFWKAIKPPKLKTDVFRLEFLTGLHSMERPIKADFQKTTATWEGEKPKFDSAISLKGPGPTLLVDASGGSDLGVKKWNWLDKGTKVRHALMSHDFIPKTQPRWVGSRNGRGRLLFVGMSIVKPGIKPREWTLEIEVTWTPRFKTRMEEAMKIAARKSGHGV